MYYLRNTAWLQLQFPDVRPTNNVQLVRNGLKRWSLICKGGQALLFFTSRNESAQQQRVLIVSKLLFGTYALLWLRSTLRTAEVEARVGSATSARRPFWKYEVKKFQQPEKLLFFIFVFTVRRYQEYIEWFWSKKHFSWWKKAPDRSNFGDKNVDHNRWSLTLPIGSRFEHQSLIFKHIDFRREASNKVVIIPANNSIGTE